MGSKVRVVKDEGGGRERELWPADFADSAKSGTSLEPTRASDPVLGEVVIGVDLAQPGTDRTVVMTVDREDRPTVRASSLNGGLTCPGSVALKAWLRDEEVDTATSYTSVGTLGHRMLQVAFEQGIPAMMAEIKDEKVEPGLLTDVLDFLDYLRAEGEISLDLAATVRAGIPGLGLETEVHYCESPMEYQAGRVLITGTRDLVQVKDKRVVVADWKFYNDPSMLPDITEDLQMIAYGVGSAVDAHATRVDVRRYLVYHRRVDVLILEGAMLDLAKDVLREEAEAIWDGRDTYRVGAQCRSCLVHERCDAYKRGGRGVQTQEIAPYVTGTFAAPGDVLQFLLAIQVVEERIAEGIEAAKAWVRLNGPVVDPVSGRTWEPRERVQDEIVDPGGCLTELLKVTDQTTALSAAKTTKGGMEEALKSKGVPPGDRRGFLDRLRDLGHLAKRTTMRWEWK